MKLLVSLLLTVVAVGVTRAQEMYFFETVEGSAVLDGQLVQNQDITVVTPPGEKDPVLQ